MRKKNINWNYYKNYTLKYYDNKHNHSQRFSTLNRTWESDITYTGRWYIKNKVLTFMSYLTSLVHTNLTVLSFPAVTFFTRKCLSFSNKFFQIRLGSHDKNTVLCTCISWLSDNWAIVFIVQLLPRFVHNLWFVLN